MRIGFRVGLPGPFDVVAKFHTTDTPPRKIYPDSISGLGLRVFIRK